MASLSVTPPTVKASFGKGNRNYRFALVSLTSLFFMWGFITCLNDILIPYLKNLFTLNYTQAMLIQFCFFSAYFIVSIPAGKLVEKLGYQRGIVVGLMIAALGCIMFYPAAEFRVYGLFLAALFVLASGITILQVSANPYVSALGSPETASSRLTMTQAFNSLGTTVAPFFGGVLILSVAANSGVEDGSSVQMPYLLLAGMLGLLALVFSRLTLPKMSSLQAEHPVILGEAAASVMHYRHLVLGAVGIFVYVGAEVSIGSFLINFLNMDSIGGLEEAEAAHYIAYYWGGAMVGRFIGAAVMQKVAAGKALAFNAVCAAILVAIAMLTSGALAMWAILLVGLCNSIMFPTIFSLAIQGLKEHTSQGSGLLCLAIVGGAVLPLLQGVLADTIGLQMSFVLPIFCFAFIAYYGLIGSKPQLVDKEA